jgi:hypothetical protein
MIVEVNDDDCGCVLQSMHSNVFSQSWENRIWKDVRDRDHSHHITSLFRHSVFHAGWQFQQEPRCTSWSCSQLS